MKHLILSLLLVLSTLECISQDYSKYFISRRVESGMMYYISPQTWVSNKEFKFTIDQTLLSGKDSVRLGISITTAQTVKPTALFLSNNSSESYPTMVEFIEPKGRNWIARFFVLVPKEKAILLYEGEQIPTLQIGYSGGKIEVGISPKSWEKVKKINYSVYQIEKINRE